MFFKKLFTPHALSFANFVFALDGHLVGVVFIMMTAFSSGSVNLIVVGLRLSKPNRKFDMRNVRVW